MTELSALAGSEGYAACDDEASVELAAKWRTTEAQSKAPVSIGRSRGRGSLIVKKRPSKAFFDSRKAAPVLTGAALRAYTAILLAPTYILA